MPPWPVVVTAGVASSTPGLTGPAIPAGNAGGERRVVRRFTAGDAMMISCRVTVGGRPRQRPGTEERGEKGEGPTRTLELQPSRHPSPRYRTAVGHPAPGPGPGRRSRVLMAQGGMETRAEFGTRTGCTCVAVRLCFRAWLPLPVPRHLDIYTGTVTRRRPEPPGPGLGQPERVNRHCCGDARGRDSDSEDCNDAVPSAAQRDANARRGHPLCRVT